jgi:hypothetical protein
MRTAQALPDRAAIKKWWEGGLEKLQKEVGHKYADFQTFSVEGVEQPRRSGGRREMVEPPSD